MTDEAFKSFVEKPEKAKQSLPGLVLRRSDLQGMIECPKRHRAQKDDLLTQSDPMRVGELVHQILVSYSGWLKQQTMWSDPETLLEIGRQIVGQQNEARLYPKVMEVLQGVRYWIRLDPNCQMEKEANYTLQVDDDLWVVMRIDHLEAIEEGLHIIDWKSGYGTLDKRQARQDLQTRCYAAGVWKSYKNVSEVHFTYKWLRYRGETHVVLREKELNEAYYGVCEAAREYKRRLDEDEWPPQPSAWCRSCDLAAECLPTFHRPDRLTIATSEEFEVAAREWFLADGARSNLQKLIRAYVNEAGPQVVDGRRFGYESAAPRWGVRKDKGDNGEEAS